MTFLDTRNCKCCLDILWEIKVKLFAWKLPWDRSKKTYQTGLLDNDIHMETWKYNLHILVDDEYLFMQQMNFA